MTRRARDREPDSTGKAGGDSEKSREGSNEADGLVKAVTISFVVVDHPASSDHPVNSAVQHLILHSQSWLLLS